MKAQLAKELAAKQLTDAIISGELKPGEHIAEEAFANRYHISRIPAREAIHQLEQSGLLVRGPYRGLYVASMSISEARELYELRGYLEGIAAKNAVQNLDDDDLTELRKRWEGAYQPDPVTGKMVLFDRCAWIHQYVMERCNHHLCKEYYANLIVRLDRYKNLSRAMRGPIPNTYHEHSIIIESLLAKDEHGAEQAMQNHILISGKMTVQFLKEHGYLEQ